MTITYRTAGAWGAGAGANLAPAQVDNNFWDLQTQVNDAIGAALEPVEISNITVSGSSMTVHMDNGDTYGPFTLPRAAFNWRGTWEDATAYAVNDVVKVADYGLYVCTVEHVSEATWDSPAEFDQMMGELDIEASPVATETATFTLEITDALKYIRCNSASIISVIVPPEESVNFDVGTEVHFRQVGAGYLSFTPGTGVTINGVDGFDDRTNGVGAVATLKKVGTDEWDLFGALNETAP